MCLGLVTAALSRFLFITHLYPHTGARGASGASDAACASTHTQSTCGSRVGAGETEEDRVNPTLNPHSTSEEVCLAPGSREGKAEEGGQEEGGRGIEKKEEGGGGRRREEEGRLASKGGGRLIKESCRVYSAVFILGLIGT